MPVDGVGRKGPVARRCRDVFPGTPGRAGRPGRPPPLRALDLRATLSTDPACGPGGVTPPEGRTAMARGRIGAALALVLVLTLGAMSAVDRPAAAAPSPNVVLSQLYGGGGNAGATLKNDFVELFNRGGSAVDLTGWSVQYAASAGSSWVKTDLTGT